MRARSDCGRGFWLCVLMLNLVCISQRALMSKGNREVYIGQRFSQMGALTRISSRARITETDFSSPRVYRARAREVVRSSHCWHTGTCC
jgi:hypothetical protein